jgi:capsid protein
VYQIVHQEFSTGETPLQKQLAKTRNVDGGQDVAVDVRGQQLADNVAVTTNKSTYNMPQGARMEAIEARTDTNFKDFYLPNVHLACAAIGIPPEVALSKYDSNFSASRAALKDWEHTIEVDRAAFSYQFYEPLKDYWFELEVLKGKILSPGFLNALFSKNQMVIDAYLNGRFVGANVPHIDPLKEVAAERAKLGPTLQSAPLTTVENATEALNGGDSKSNIKRAGQELLEVEKAGLKSEKTSVEKPNEE